MCTCVHVYIMGKPRGKTWDAECQQQKRAQLRETEEGKQKLKKHSGTPPSKEVRLKSKVKCDFLKHVAQCEAWRNRFGDLPWSGAGPVGRGDVPGLERQLGFWVDRMRANAGKLPPECASRWVLLCSGQAHLLLEDGSSNPGPRESASTEEPILVQEAQDETQREMEVKEDPEIPSLLSRARFACQERIHIAVTFRTYGPLRAAHRGSGFCEDKPPW